MRCLGTCDTLLTLSHHLQVVLDRVIVGTLIVHLDLTLIVHLEFSAAFDRASHRGLSYKLKSIGVRGQFLPIISEFLRNRRQSVRLPSKVSASINVVSGVLQYSVVLYTSELFYIVGKHIVGYMNNTTVYAVIPRSLSRPQVLESLNQDLAASGKGGHQFEQVLEVAHKAQP